MSIGISFPQEHVALVTIADPARRNALGPADFQALAQAWTDLAERPALRCVVVAGEGEAAFCSGASLDADFSAIADVDDLVDRALLKARYFPLPLVAAVNGHCVAGGFELMLAADVRIASRQARLGLPEVRWGIMPSGGGAMKLIDQIGYAPAMELMLTADLITAQEALERRLVNRVVEPAQVLPVALQVAARIAANSPLAVRNAKQAALAPRAERWARAEPQERRLAREVRASEDNAAGRQAFLRKATPVYR